VWALRNALLVALACLCLAAAVSDAFRLNPQTTNRGGGGGGGELLRTSYRGRHRGLRMAAGKGQGHDDLASDFCLTVLGGESDRRCAMPWIRIDRCLRVNTTHITFRSIHASPHPQTDLHLDRKDMELHEEGRQHVKDRTAEIAQSLSPNAQVASRWVPAIFDLIHRIV